MEEGSPLRVHTERQAKLLKGLLGQRGHHLERDLGHALRLAIGSRMSSPT